MIKQIKGVDTGKNDASIDPSSLKLKIKIRLLRRVQGQAAIVLLRRDFTHADSKNKKKKLPAKGKEQFLPLVRCR